MFKKNIIPTMARKKKALGEVKTCQELITCVFGLGEYDLQVYRLLLDRGELRAVTVGELIGKDRSTAYRILQRLVHCGLCEKEKRYLPDGGYYHVYSAIPIDKVKLRTRECVDRWYKGVLEQLNRIEEIVEL